MVNGKILYFLLLAPVICLPVFSQELGVRDHSLQGLRETVPAVQDDSLKTIGFGLPGQKALLKDNLGIYRKEISVDLEKGTVQITETVMDLPLRFPLVTSLDAFMKVKAEADLKDNWRSTEMVTEEVAQKSGFFQIDIPVEFPKKLQDHLGRGGHLRVSGYRLIKFGGRSFWEKGKDVQSSTGPDWIPNLEMQQQSEFKIEGRIGDKINVYVDQSTERLSELENAIKINYTGDEDEIIQEIEAGNTFLSLPNTRFVSASEQHKGLFGVKVRMKIGYLDLTAIASQQKGSTEKMSIPLGATLQEDDIRDYNYKQRTYYWVHTDSTDSVIDVDVYVSTPGRLDKSTSYDTGFVFIDPDAVSDSLLNTDGYKDWYIFHPLVRGEQADYQVYTVGQGSYIRFGTNYNVEEDYVVAVAYQYKKRGSTTVSTVGTYEWKKGSGRSLVLKLIKTENPDTSSPTWDYEWKNVYDLGARNLSLDGFKLDIYRIPEGEGEPLNGQNGTSYLRLFGLDKDGNGIDLEPSIIDTARGELIFPYPYPFDHPSLTAADRLPKLYNSPRRFDPNESKFFIRVRSKSIKSEYQLGYMNIIQGSEVVTLDGRKLSGGSDYVINYTMGTITFRNQEVFKPGARVSVDFEYMPFFTPDQKTLLGMRGEFKFLENSHVGFTTVYKRQSTLDRRIQLGREPTQGLIWDLDAALRLKPKWMTLAVDALPFIKTETPSTFDLSGEIAQSLSDPNVEGEAIVEDFEGSKAATDLGVIRSYWTVSSVPETSLFIPGAAPDTALRGKLIWYNPFDREKIGNIWPKRIEGAGAQWTVDDEVNIMVMQFVPKNNDSTSWGGIMQSLYTGYHDQTESRYLEIWAWGNRGYLNIDLGEISEDAIPNGRLDTEDKNFNGSLDEDEDIGLNGLTNAQEGADSLADDYSYSYEANQRNNYWRINGTEKSRGDRMRFNKMDTEDIDNDNRLDQENSYFSFGLDLSKNTYVVPGTYADPANPGGWRLYRIPLWNITDTTYRQVGFPQPHLVKFARLWLNGVTDTTMVKLASVEIVGNDWLEVTPDTGDTFPFNISVKNEYENHDYDPPAEVRQKYEEEQDIIYEGNFNEQSLVLTYSDLPAGQTVRAYNDNFFQIMDFTRYRRFKFYLRGHDIGSQEYPYTVFYICFGSDSLNYYGVEVKIPSQWTTFEFDLARFTELKLNAQEEDSIVGLVSRGRLQKTVGDTTFEVRGSPSFTAVKWMQVGVKHLLFSPLPKEEVAGEIWVDDIILLGAKRETGLASRISLNTAFSDLATFSGNLENRDEGFAGLNEVLRNLSRQRNYSLNGDLRLGRFLPSEWGVNIPLTGSMTKAEQIPRYKPGTDIELLTEKDKERNKNAQVGQRASLSYSKNRDAANPLVNLTLDRIDADYSFSNQFNRTSTRTDTTIIYRSNLTWDLTPRRQGSFSPLKWVKTRWVPGFITNTQITYLPNNLKTNLNLTSNYSKIEDRFVEKATIDSTRDFNHRYDVGYNPLPTVNNTYSLNLRNDCRNDLTWEKISHGHINVGKELDRAQKYDLQWRPTWVKWVGQTYNYSVNFTESQDPRKITSYRLGKRNINWDRTWKLDYTWTLAMLKNYLPKKQKVEAQPFSTPWYWGQFKNGLNKAGDFLPTITTGYQRGSSISDYGILGRPDLAFQFGLTDEYQLPRDTVSQGVTAVSSRKDNEQKDLGVNANLSLAIFTLQCSYNYTYKRDAMLNQETYDRSETFPQLNLRINSVEKLPLAANWMTRSSVHSAFSRKLGENGDLKKAGGWLWYLEGDKKPKSETETFDFSPFLSWSINWKNGITTTLEYKRSVEETRGLDFNSFTSRKKNQNFTLSAQHQITAKQGIKFWKLRKIQFSKALNTTLSISVAQNSDETKTVSDVKFKPTTNWLKWSVIPQADYQFSSKVDGGAKIEVSRNRERVADYTSHTVLVEVWAQLRF